jgi:zinc transport system permease protein
VIALLTIPPYIAEKYSRSLAQMMMFSTILAIIFNFSGLWLAYTYNLTSGATIILVAATVFFISMIIDLLLNIKHQNHAAGLNND